MKPAYCDIQALGNASTQHTRGEAILSHQGDPDRCSTNDQLGVLALAATTAHPLQRKSCKYLASLNANNRRPRILSPLTVVQYCINTFPPFVAFAGQWPSPLFPPRSTHALSNWRAPQGPSGSAEVIFHRICHGGSSLPTGPQQAANRFTM
uniref:Uncharacterized protein n=1 Tax=Eutreptiella gymnastica TaxID=73025 RepID=A0A7S1HTD3_9EUGL|mmetsp:Transcript_104535/g.180112  ORF Transcript_104535/g.180112 Transcript_104535/m.180112 type:complete len:151 (+) Transcript_104535:73-525(+)